MRFLINVQLKLKGSILFNCDEYKADIVFPPAVRAASNSVAAGALCSSSCYICSSLIMSLSPSEQIRNRSPWNNCPVRSWIST